MTQVAFQTAPHLDTARQQVRAAGRSYAGRRAVAVLLPTLAGLLLLGALAARWPASGAARLAGLAAVLAVAAGRLWPLRHRGPATTARQLDRLFPELEDSTGLLLQAPEQLPLLGQLQQQRVGQRLAGLAATQAPLLPVFF